MLATIVAVVVTAVVMPWALPEATQLGLTGAAAQVGAGAMIMGAADAAYQGTEMLAGNQSKFNWSELGASAVAGGISGGLGLMGGTAGPLSHVSSGLGQAVFDAAGSNAIHQGVNMALGLQKTFSWTSLAVSSVAAGAAYETFGSVQGDKLTRSVLAGTAAVLAGAATNSLLTGNDLGKSVLEALPSAIGSTIGEMIGEQVNQSADSQGQADNGDTITLGPVQLQPVDNSLPEMPTLDVAFSGVDGAAAIGDAGGDSSIDRGACFVAGTMVHTEKGLKAIETIAAGDMVASRDQENADTSVRWRRVKQTHVHTDRMVTRLLLDHANGMREEITTTTEHPFYVDGSRWVQAGDLRPGDRFELIDGKQSVLVAVEPDSGLHTVHNLTIDQDHTYFVGEAGIWVHNVDGSFYTNSQGGQVAINHVKANGGLTDTGQLKAVGPDLLPQGASTPYAHLYREGDGTPVLVFDMEDGSQYKLDVGILAGGGQLAGEVQDAITGQQGVANYATRAVNGDNGGQITPIATTQLYNPTDVPLSTPNLPSIVVNGNNMPAVRPRLVLAGFAPSGQNQGTLLGYVGSSLAGMGQATVGKPWYNPESGASEKTSVISKTFRSIFGDAKVSKTKIPFTETELGLKKLWPPTAKRLGAKSNLWGGVLGRWAPVVGYGAIILDVATSKHPLRTLVGDVAGGLAGMVVGTALADTGVFAPLAFVGGTAADVLVTNLTLSAYDKFVNGGPPKDGDW